MPIEKINKEDAPITYREAVGRRKTAHARVRLQREEAASFLIGEQAVEQYFKTDEQRRIAREALAFDENDAAHTSVSARVSGGGLSAQAEAIRHGIARALVSEKPELRKKLKQAGFLKRDPRAKERRKFGLKKARKSPQWSKR